jgi:CubicO group peptidase (beta-lactamase class C family)
MTALLAAMLVEEGKLRWGSTVGEFLGGEAAGAYAVVRLDQLLSNTAGIPEMPPMDVWLSFFGTGKPVTEERKRMVREVLAQKPASAPGTAFLYSNFGYVLAGRIIEVAAGKSWEDSLRERLFAPLGMERAGFGPPATAGADPPDAPWGHSPEPVDPARPGADNPPALGPAGTVHASLRDMERYVGLYLRGGIDAGGNRLVSEESLEEIYRPRMAGYGLGWGVLEENGVRYLQHAGSNTTFVCQILIAPARGFAVVVMTNRGDETARMRTGELVERLRRYFGG